jgi:hypothetical protein
MQLDSRSTAWEAANPGRTLRDLARARRRQLALALCGEVVASAAYAERVRRIRRHLAGGTVPQAHGASPA